MGMDTKKTVFRRLCCRILQAAQKLAVLWDRILLGLISLLVIFGFVWYCLRYTIPEETALRYALVQKAEGYLGFNESDGTHKAIIDRYNTLSPLPRDYAVTYTDSWCAVFATVAALEQELTSIIPPECSCEQQIMAFEAAGCWIEADWYLPKPGDYIFYDWNWATRKDSTGWSDHVGIVAETFGPIIKVIEGNKNDDVSYRYVFLNDPTIRGFGLPDYGSVCMIE